MEIKSPQVQTQLVLQLCRAIAKQEHYVFDKVMKDWPLLNDFVEINGMGDIVVRRHAEWDSFASRVVNGSLNDELNGLASQPGSDDTLPRATNNDSKAQHVERLLTL